MAWWMKNYAKYNISFFSNLYREIFEPIENYLFFVCLFASLSQITFPGHYTNTCCSHPLYTPKEMEEEDAWGVRTAAQRRLEFELGIPHEQAQPKDFTYLTRIHYASPSSGRWGEHEMDYILFLRGDVSVSPNENEVQDVRYVKREDFSRFLSSLRENDVPITPWFHLIAQKFLPLWWKNLDDIGKFIDHRQIHRMINWLGLELTSL